MTYRSLVWWLLMLVGGVCGWWLYGLTKSEVSQDVDVVERPPLEAKELAASRIEISVFCPRLDLSGLEDLRIFVPDRRDSLSGWVRLLIEPLQHPPFEGCFPALPSGTTVLHVFADDRGGLHVDFSAAILNRASTGTQMEALSIKALIHTLQKNMPGYRFLGILVEGSERESLWGHVYTRKPFSFE